MTTNIAGCTLASNACLSLQMDKQICIWLLFPLRPAVPFLHWVPWPGWGGVREEAARRACALEFLILTPPKCLILQLLGGHVEIRCTCSGFSILFIGAHICAYIFHDKFLYLCMYIFPPTEIRNTGHSHLLAIRPNRHKLYPQIKTSQNQTDRMRHLIPQYPQVPSAQ